MRYVGRVSGVLWTGAAVLILSVSYTLPAAADCCDDFWNCVATVATGGLSCKAQQIAAAIDGTKKLIAAVEKTRAGFQQSANDTVAETQKDVSSASSAMKGDLQDSLNKIKSAMNQTESVASMQTMRPSLNAGTAGPDVMARAPAGPSVPASPGAQSSAVLKGSASAPAGKAGSAGGGAGAAMPFSPTADPARVRADLTRALQWVQSAGANAETQQAPVVRGHADEAPKQVARDESSARKIVSDQLLSPLDAVKAQLDHILATILNPIDFSSVTKYVDAQVNLIQGQAPTTFNEMAQQLSSGAGNQLNEGQKGLDDVKKQASDSQKVADQAKKLAESRTKSDLDKLEALIGGPLSDASLLASGAVLGASGKAPGSSSIASEALKETHVRTKAAQIRAQGLSAGLVSQWDATRKLLPAGSVAVTLAMHQKVSGDLSKMFVGRSAEDAKKSQQQLLSEARVRFASDPRTLAAVEKYLQAQTSSFLTSSSAPLRR